MDTQWCYTSPKDLHNIVSSKEAGRDYIVIDVRDDDFAGGHVKGCLRAPFQHYEDGLSQLVSRVKDVPIVIFHCTLSQVRGPKSARMYAEMRNASAKPGQASTQEVFVLQGGFAALQAAYKDDPIIEGWEPSVWEDPFELSH